jgi:hypothetical protein
MRRLLNYLVVAPLLLLCVAIVLMTGCLPDWLPNSRHVVLIRGDGKVVLFDVKDQSQKVLGDAGKSGGAIKPAVSPDGKQIAVCRMAQIVQQQGQIEFQIVIYNLDGKEIHVSAKETIKDPRGNKSIVPTGACYWSPDGKHLLVATPFIAAVRVYHLADNSFERFDEVVTATTIPHPNFAILHVSPFTPDSKGFLGLEFKLPSSQPKDLKIYSWGNEQPKIIPIPREVKDTLRSIGDQPHVLLPPEWKDGKLIYRLNGTQATVDPAALTITVQQPKDMKPLLKHAETHKVMILYAFPNGNLIQSSKEPRGVELWQAKEQKATALGKFDPYGGGVSAIPAPDGKHVIVFYQQTANQRHFTIFDAAGNSVAKMTDSSGSQ